MRKAISILEIPGLIPGIATNSYNEPRNTLEDALADAPSLEGNRKERRAAAKQRRLRDKAFQRFSASWKKR